MLHRIQRVTGGQGGESLLIEGSQKTAVYDSGMAWCGKQLVSNLKKALGKKPLDYVLLTHTHYDHVGGLPYLRQEWPDLIAVGAAHGKKVLEKQSALNAIRELSDVAARLYLGPDTPALDYKDSMMKIDLAVQEGDRISLGDRTIRILETKGHTNCSISFYMEEESILLLSESTGVITDENRMTSSILTSYHDAMASFEKCQRISARQIVVPHFLELPETMIDGYWHMAKEAAEGVKAFILACLKEGLPEETILQKSIEPYWVGEEYQPLEAFLANMKAKINVVRREFYRS